MKYGSREGWKSEECKRVERDKRRVRSGDGEVEDRGWRVEEVEQRVEGKTRRV